MRRRTRVWIGATITSILLVLAAGAPVSSEGYLFTNGDFEGGTTGWAPPSGAALVVDASAPSPSGGNAAHLTATGTGIMTIANQYWQSPDVVPGATYRLTAFVRDDDVATSEVTARLSFEFDPPRSVGEQVMGTLDPTDSASYRAVATAGLVAPTGAKHLRVTFTARASSAGARLSIDGVTVTVTPPPTPTPSPTPEPAPPPPEDVPEAPPAVVPTPGPTPAPTSTPRPISTPRATSTPRPAATPRATAAPTATPTPTPLPERWLRNATFDQGATGWSVTRGRLRVTSLVDGRGPSLVLTADDSATTWVQQTVAVTPGGWFTASALLAPLDGTEAAWIRIAWYAQADGSGAQLATEDSPAVASVAPNALARVGGYEVVSTGPVQAPPDALSARIRVLLRAADEHGASVLIDDVTFEVSDPPEVTPPAPVPAARVRAPEPTATSVETPEPRTETSRTEAPSVRPSTAATASPGTSQVAALTPQTDTSTTDPAPRRLRITEVVSNPDEGGPDGEFEWIEVTNTGSAPASLAGLSVRDRRSGNTLPPYVIDPGAVVVIAAPGASLPDGVPLVRLRRAIGNGLGNAGDRVALVAADGREIDAVAYGEGVEEGESRLPAPGPGQSLERLFSAAGILLDARLAEPPTPGVATAPRSARDAEAKPSTHAATAPGGLEDLAPAWALLLALAGGLLLGAAVARAASLARGRDVEA